MKTTHAIMKYSLGALTGMLLIGLVSCGLDLKGKAGISNEVRPSDAVANSVKAKKHIKATRTAKHEAKESKSNAFPKEQEKETRDSLIVIIDEMPASPVAENQELPNSGDQLEIDTTGYADILNEVLVVEIDTSDLPY